MAQEVRHIIGRGTLNHEQDRKDDPNQQRVDDRHRGNEFQCFKNETGFAWDKADKDCPNNERYTCSRHSLNRKLGFGQLAADHADVRTEIPKTDIELGQGLTKKRACDGMSAFVEEVYVKNTKSAMNRTKTMRMIRDEVFVCVILSLYCSN